MNGKPETRTAREAGWHFSRYNIAAEISGTEQAVIANLFRGNCAVCGPEELYLLSEAENLPENHPILPLFQKRGLLVDFDEREALAEMGRKDRDERDFVTLTVCTTMRCNFDCPYCFERHSGVDMSEKTQEDVAALAERMLAHFKPKRLHVIWFGGEPLLNPDVIWKLTEKLRALAQRRFVGFACADATRPEALLSAVGEAEGELCLMTEGLLMYLSAGETALLCAGVKSLLSRFGGCWITADPEMPLQLFLTLRAICGDRFAEVTKSGFRRKAVSNGRYLPSRPADPSPLQIEVGADASAQTEKAGAFLAEQGLKADRMPMSVLVREPILPERLSPKQAQALNEALDAVSCWVITAD